MKQHMITGLFIWEWLSSLRLPIDSFFLSFSLHYLIPRVSMWTVLAMLHPAMFQQLYGEQGPPKGFSARRMLYLSVYVYGSMCVCYD